MRVNNDAHAHQQRTAGSAAAANSDVTCVSAAVAAGQF